VLADAHAQQLGQGKQLQEVFLQSHQKLQQAAQEALMPQASQTAECSSGWLGRHDPAGECMRIDIRKGQPLELQCVVPSRFWRVGDNSFGGHAVSHMHGGARKAITRFADNKALANFARTNIVLSVVGSLGLVLANPQARQQAEVIFSKLRLVSTADLQDVDRVQVLEGTIPFGLEWNPSGPATIVRQLVFHKRNGSSVKVSDCSDSQLMGTAGSTHAYPPEGSVGQIVAVSGQGNALKFHWIRTC
jgi:hypothetical protein